ncbi:MAG TPA: hypothetical protein VGQ83_42340 [Polyangia bacterium]|jgi:hypothetical protein
MYIRTVTMLALCAFALSAGGCCRSIKEKLFESAVESAVESGGNGKTKAKLNLSKGSFEITGDKGEKVNFGGGAATKVPDSWPKDVPIYTGIKPTFSMTTDKGSSITFESTEAPQKIYEYYMTTMPAQGWKINIKAQTDEGGMASFEKAPKRSAIVTISSSSGKTAGSLSVAQN